MCEFAMQVELTVDGGFACFPGLAKPIIVDAARLSGADAAHLERLCAAALAAARRSATPPAATVCDARRYHLTIDIDGVQRELDAADPVSQPAVAALITFVTDVGRR